MTQFPNLASSLASILDPLLAVPGASDIAINAAPSRDQSSKVRGTTAYCLIGEKWRPVLLTGVYLEDLELLARVLANRNGTDFRPTVRPILDAVLPQGYRIVIIGGPHVRYDKTDTFGLAWVIRIDATSPRPNCEPAPFVDDDIEPANAYTGADEPWLGEAMQLAAAGKAILFVGPKHSGKTYRLNQLLSRLPLVDRLLLLEDPRECMPPHRNRLCLWYPRTGKTNDLDEADILSAMRRAGDAVVVFGEFTPRLARFSAEVIETGCVAFLGTFHAKSAGDIYRYLHRNVGSNHAFLKEHFPKVAQCRRAGGQFLIQFLDIDDCRAASGVEGVGAPQGQAHGPDADAEPGYEEDDVHA